VTVAAGPIEDQMQHVRRVCHQAVTKPLPDGTTLVTLIDVPLASGWNQVTTTVNFVVPTGYPVAKPDCFYADGELRLANGAMPQSSRLEVLPGTGESRLWFSWHVSSWNPSTDTLITYLRVIQRRLTEVR
jgi:hypothetical protein